MDITNHYKMKNNQKVQRLADICLDPWKTVTYHPIEQGGMQGVLLVHEWFSGCRLHQQLAFPVKTQCIRA